jgi:[ribosomal protein S5]-alanine N-acetyltransferase
MGTITAPTSPPAEIAPTITAGPRVVYYEGERIYFRPIEPSDEPLIRRWINDPRVWSTLGVRSPINEPRERERIENFGKSEHDYHFGMVVRDGDRLIGSLGLHDINWIARRATLGIMIGEVEYQNQGYGSEAIRLALRYGFEVLNLHRMELAVYDFNPRAIHVYEAAGFVLEGRRRQAAFAAGRYADVLGYAILRDEWVANRSRTPRDDLLETRK